MRPTSAEMTEKMLPPQLAELCKRNLCEQLSAAHMFQVRRGREAAQLQTGLTAYFRLSLFFLHLNRNRGLRSRSSSGQTRVETFRARRARITPDCALWCVKSVGGRLTLGPCCARAPPVRSLAPPYCRGVVVCRAAKRHSAPPYGSGRRILGRTRPHLPSPEGSLCCCSFHVN